LTSRAAFSLLKRSFAHYYHRLLLLSESLREIFISSSIITTYLVFASNDNTKNVYINGKMVANIGDQANQDNLCGVPFQSSLHCNPYATTGSSDVFVGDP
jgi:hypothetical protein